MPPAASRYCYCVCDKKRRKHPGVRLQLFPKDARSAISISGDWARCGSRGDSSTIIPEIWHTVIVLTLMLECCLNPVPATASHHISHSHSLPPHKPQPQPPTTSVTATANGWDTNKKPPMKHHLFAYAACP
ncbi:hypothetical protein GWK47_036445 [Chionoecetes opilio]|uniref:Uncharacterized protein n=1 Tax=Chionoecetes opilio TaxID=41210 RepID=A0A8J4YT69_CHIOP|nr:hypothetical protein GWK47_036445 [Chionoecetes opilio]